MWRWLHPYAKPEKTYQLNQTLFPWFAIPGCVLLAVGIIWGLLFAPADYQQGDSYRIIFVHVPAAFWAMGFYMSMAIAALSAVVWQIRTAEWAIIAIAPVGAVFTFISLFSGAVWGKPMWGTWWEWDARLTSQLILLFLYFGVMALYAAFDDQRMGGKAAGVLTLIGVINIPIIHFSVYWWNTLHQQSTVSKLLRFEKPSMAPEMLWPLLICIGGMSLVGGALILLRLNNIILQQESKRPWAQALLLKEHQLKEHQQHGRQQQEER